ncbi:cupin domain-containing protein [Streptacidiphilus melanogenes]|uniref:cupin domain-containing protein n=1 Tax=Streptacidiphilus melanogenes TaxID=411235 RepID=UPI000694B588|nr:cupin domain-containing protein [Streptacidiphilus melanogenes]
MTGRPEVWRGRGEGRRFTVGPSSVLVKVSAAETGGRFALIEWTIPPGAPAPPRHIHRNASETFFVLDGSLSFPLDEGTVTACAGDCLHVPPGTAHTLANAGDRPVRALELFAPGALMGLVEEVGQVFAAGPRPDRAALLAAFARHDSALAPDPTPHPQ